MTVVIKKTFKIDEPIWKTKSVGLSLDGIQRGLVSIEILYKDKHGVQVYPGKYLIDAEKARTYPIQRVKWGKMLHIIPIEDLHKWV